MRSFKCFRGVKKSKACKYPFSTIIGRLCKINKNIFKNASRSWTNIQFKTLYVLVYNSPVVKISGKPGKLTGMIWIKKLVILSREWNTSEFCQARMAIEIGPWLHNKHFQFIYFNEYSFKLRINLIYFNLK